MTIHLFRRRALSTPGQLVDALKIPFSEEQLAAIVAPLEPSVIVAGAGSGKTTVMAARVVWLVGTGQVNSDQVLGLTFTRKAAAELASRISEALARAGVVADQDEGAELVMTYDSFAARLVSEFGLRLGIDKDPVMVTGASRFRLATRVVTDAQGPFRSISRLSHHSIPERVLALDAEMQSHLVTGAEIRAESGRADAGFRAAPLFRGRTMADVAKAINATAERLELLELVESYQALKDRLGVVEFADQLREAVRLATLVPAVGAELRARFGIVLLDEYQDTSAAQAKLLRELFAPSIAAGGPGFPVTAVGDPYQAIYGWRGAAAANILEFPQQFRRTDGSPALRQTLSINRRSGQRILDVGNALVAGLRASTQDGGVSLVAPPQTPPGAVAAACFDTFLDEIDWLVETVISRHTTGVAWCEQAVLVRRNAALAPIFQALRDRDVPVEIVGLGGLLALPEIAPVVATLRVIDDVTANPDVAALLTGSRWALGLADLEALGIRARELATTGERPTNFSDSLSRAVTQSDPGEIASLCDAIADPGEAPLSEEGRRRIARFHAELTQLRRHAAEPVVDLVARVIDTIGIEVELLAGGVDTAQLERFLAEVGNYVDVDGDGSLSGLLAYLDAEEDYGEGLLQAVPSQADSVKLLTVHRAKGLEWDTVFLPCLVDKVFPSEPRSGIWPLRSETLPAGLRGDADSIPQLLEYTKRGLDAYRDALKSEHQMSEDRLAYVGATRAKQLLVASAHVWTSGNVRPRAESPYFAAIRQRAETLGTYLDVTTRDLDANPIPAQPIRASWPEPLELDRVTALRSAGRLVAEAVTCSGAGQAVRDDWVWQSGTVSELERDTVAAWDDSARHLRELRARGEDTGVEAPDGLSVTALMAMRRDPEGFAATLLRRMPRRPSTAARVGVRFHNWLQERFQLPASLDEVVPESGANADELAKLVDAFCSGQFANRTPIGVEVPFLMRRGQHILRGRIDAVYSWDAAPYRYLVVDWKTSDSRANPLQLAVYRQAWAEAKGVAPSEVAAAFYHVATDELRLITAPAQLIDQAIATGEGP